MPRLSSTGRLHLAEVLEQIEVLHVARADLQDVDVAHHHLDLRAVHDLADDQQVVAIGGVAQVLQALLAHALERVRRGARLERAAAHDAGAGGGDDRRDRVDLLLRLDRARAGHEHDFGSADLHAFSDVDDRVLLLELARRQLEGRGDAHDLGHAVEHLELPRIDVAVDDADHANHRLLLAVGAVRLEALGLDVLEHRVDLLGRRVRRHHDHHGGALLGAEYTRATMIDRWKAVPLLLSFAAVARLKLMQ